MTLLKKDCEDIPGWDKASLFLNKNKNVIIEKGVDGTGNLYNCKNYIHCIKNYKNSMDFITGDGGFDFSVNYNEQETQATRLILTQIAYAIGMQKKGGCFILKVFDLFTEPSLDFLYLLSSFYKNVSIIKPYTSRLANSEKYIVCQNFKFEDTTEIIIKFSSILHVLDNMSFKDIKISKILDVKINYYYIKTIEEINAILYHQQISNILLTLRIIQNNEKKTEKIELMKNKNIKKCLNWCAKNRIPHNRFGISSNIFLSGSRFNA
jgi:23S rRNA U2552 (ribose-2'-O)-methylase RlmE/FtsJ